MNGLCHILLLAIVIYYVQSQDRETRTRSPTSRRRERIIRGPRPSRPTRERVTLTTTTSTTTMRGFHRRPRPTPNRRGSTTTMNTTQESEGQSYYEDDFISLNEDGSLSCTEDRDCPDYSNSPDELVSKARRTLGRSSTRKCLSVKCSSR